jgi:polysaccharide export outer membrane protein
MDRILIFRAVALTGALALPAAAVAQGAERPAADRVPTPPTASVPVPGDYVIGPDDVIGVLIWRESEMSGDMTVRPDGMITLPLVGDVKAAGFRPDELKAHIEKAASKFVTEPTVTIVVRQINSRKVFITGEVTRPGAYPITADHSVMQLIAVAGGLTEYADANNIMILRVQDGKQRAFKFHYKDVLRGKALPQNIQLMPGDTVVVP